MASTSSLPLPSKIERSISLFSEMQSFTPATDEAGLQLQDLQRSAGIAKDSINKLPYEADLRGYHGDRYKYTEWAGKHLLKVQAYTKPHLHQYYTLKQESLASAEAQESNAQELELKRRSSLKDLGECRSALKGLHTLLDNMKGVANKKECEEVIKFLTSNYGKDE